VSSTAYNGPRQKHEPRIIILARLTGNPDAGKAISFKVPIPDSRLRVKISILFTPLSGAFPNLLAAGNTMWLRETEDDRGASGRTVPCLDLEGLKAAPIGIPQTADLAGYSREFITSADNIEGDLQLVGVATFIGTVTLQCRYQPDSVTFTQQEWDEIRREAVPVADGSLSV
jgi:hypothetical protein